jgi:predicted metal-dependent enzyme (double-stranded beta helix superfamily)
MPDKDRFIQDCIDAVGDGQSAIRQITESVIRHESAVMSWFGEPQHAGLFPIYRSRELTIINFTWAPYMSLMPHNHNMFAVIGIYAGREDNIFWRRTENSIVAAGAKSIGSGETVTLGHDIIHSVLNPTGKMTCALHVYGGDFFEPEEPRREWDPETLAERAYDVEKAKRLFREAEERFYAQK